ncbi:MAG: HlyD family efflux transporter periplasmic adaptor subunit [Verrucomicrobiales bacterium]|nr:HlyD family efflux transporter periplasmic adaptor subunit [Verrucomicrobiales bacterium]
MSDPAPIHITSSSDRRPESVAGADPTLAESRKAEAGTGPAPARKFPAPIPPKILGQLTALPESAILPATLEGLTKLHGGWGCLLYQVEDGLALAASSPIGDGAPPAPVCTPVTIVPAQTLRDRYHQAAGELLQLACEPAAREAVATGDSILVETELAGQRCLVIALPVYEGGVITGCLCRVHPPNQRGEATAIAGLQLAGVLRALSASRSETHRIRSRFGKVAAFVELLAAAEGGVDFAECARRLANHLREVLECDTVALAVCGRLGTPRLAAVSGESGPAETHTPGRRALLAHLTEAIHRRQPLVTRRPGATGHAASPDAGSEGAVSLREWFDPALSLCLPLIDAAGQLRGAWIFLWRDEPADLDEKRTLIQAASPEVAPLLSLLHRAKPGAALGPVLRLWQRGTLSQRRLAAAGIALLLLAGLIPLPYPVRATCELQPVVRRVIAAPFDGILERSTVRAGEKVTAGQLLAVLDGREVRSQLSEAIARRERALKESDLALAQDRVAEARMAAHEADGLGHEIERLEYRQAHLEIRSPIDGIVLQGDLDRSEGAPLRVGDPLFEVGPLDRLVAEIAVEATDISLVRPGAPVSLKLESAARTTLSSEISHIPPRSEWVGESNVFLCEAELPNPDAELRAGLKGKCRVSGPRRPLLWIWARDAWLALRYRLW